MFKEKINLEAQIPELLVCQDLGEQSLDHIYPPSAHPSPPLKGVLTLFKLGLQLKGVLASFKVGH